MIFHQQRNDIFNDMFMIFLKEYHCFVDNKIMIVIITLKKLFRKSKTHPLPRRGTISLPKICLCGFYTNKFTKGEAEKKHTTFSGRQIAYMTGPHPPQQNQNKQKTSYFPRDGRAPYKALRHIFYGYTACCEAWFPGRRLTGASLLKSGDAQGI